MLKRHDPNSKFDADAFGIGQHARQASRHG